MKIEKITPFGVPDHLSTKINIYIYDVRLSPLNALYTGYSMSIAVGKGAMTSSRFASVTYSHQQLGGNFNTHTPAC